jgi:nucleoside triphosphate diphosphatase
VSSEDQPPIQRLLQVMARLRDPDGGCPWDLEQDFSTIAPYTIEEAYEVADAIARGDLAHLKDELGDLLLQVVYHAQMAKEAGLFDFDEVAAAIADKMIRRHPHVFGSAEVDGARAQSHAWEAVKAAERASKAGAAEGSHGVLDDVPLALPALVRAAKLQRRAARVGFDWPEPVQVLDKIEEEIAELRAELKLRANQDRLTDEIGDLLFAAVNLARHLDVDGEVALRQANAKFERRFRAIEEALRARGRRLEDASLDEMEALWQRAKAAERG